MYSKGIIHAHGTHCGRLLRACLSAIHTACLEDTVANTKGKRKKEGGQNQKWPRGDPQVRAGGAESEVAHKWAGWLHNPCRLGGSPPLQSGGQNQKWPTSGPGGYISLAALGVPTASQRGAESELAHVWAMWLHNPCRLGGLHRFTAGGRIRSGPQVGRVAT